MNHNKYHCIYMMQKHNERLWVRVSLNPSLTSNPNPNLALCFNSKTRFLLISF